MKDSVEDDAKDSDEDSVKDDVKLQIIILYCASRNGSKRMKNAKRDDDTVYPCHYVITVSLLRHSMVGKSLRVMSVPFASSLCFLVSHKVHNTRNANSFRA
jgi:hypothetical protein